MTSFRTCLFSISLIVLSFFELSCDLLHQGSTLYGVLRELKFRVTEIKAEQPARLNRLDVLILWQLHEALDEGEIEEIHHFVERGGTLIVAGDRSALEFLLFDFGLEMRKASKPLETSQRIPVAPVFPNRPVNEIFSRTDFAIQSIERDVAPLFGKEMDYSIVTFREGNGRAFFMSCPYIFNDSGLGDDRNATFLYNLMTTLPRRARIGLAESQYYAFGSIDATNPLIHLLFKTPVGLGVVYIGLIIFLFLILRGKRFGKPLVVEETHRRFSSEYVLAMTALYQKGNTRSAILKQIRDTFRSDLAARWNINPKLNTASFVEEIAKRRPIDTDELQELLTGLELHGGITEAHLLALAKQVEAYRDKEKIGRTRLVQR
jgi:hypothetical protein